MSNAYQYESSSAEAEAFMESVNEAARSGRRYRPLALAAMAAARAALSEGRQPDVESEFESTLEGEWESSPQAFQQSFLDREAAPSAAMMEHLGHMAVQAESNGEAFAFLAPLLPLALKALPLASKIGAKLLPKVASKVVKVAPKLIKGVNAAAKTLRNNPATKPLVQALPQVVRRTAADLAQQVAQGKAIDGNVAVRALANQTAKLLSDPRATVQALGRAQALDQKVDQAVTSMIQNGSANGSNGGFTDGATLGDFLRGAENAAAPCTCGSQPL
jgi:hypothetical protein